jgi:hypothetical protein
MKTKVSVMTQKDILARQNSGYTLNFRAPEFKGDFISGWYQVYEDAEYIEGCLMRSISVGEYMCPEAPNKGKLREQGIFWEIEDVLGRRGVRAVMVGDRNNRFGVAICNKQDRFNEKFGIALAVHRMITHNEVPQVYREMLGLLFKQFEQSIKDMNSPYARKEEIDGLYRGLYLAENSMLRRVEKLEAIVEELCSSHEDTLETVEGVRGTCGHCCGDARGHKDEK